MMPMLFIFFIILAIRSLTLDGAMEGVRFLFVPDWSHLTGSTFLLALGQAFFSLSVGVTAMMTYASYLPKEEKLGQSAVNVVDFEYHHFNFSWSCYISRGIRTRPLTC